MQANNDALLTIGNVKNLEFNAHTGGVVAAETATTRDPGAKFSRTLAGPKAISNLTVTVDWNEGKHAAALELLTSYAGDDTTIGSCGCIRRDGSGKRIGIRTYDVFVISCAGGDGDTNGGATKDTMIVELACQGVIFT